MKVFDLNGVTPDFVTRDALYDPLTGEQILKSGGVLTARVIDACMTLGFKRALIAENDEDLRKMRRSIRFTKVPLLSIKPDTSMGSDLYDEEGRFLVAKGTKLTSSILSSLARRHVQSVFLQRSIEPEKMDNVAKLQAMLRSIFNESALPELPKVSFSSDEVLTDSKALNPRSLDLMSRQMELSGKMKVDFDPSDGLRKQMRSVDAMVPRDNHHKQKFVDVYTKLLRSTENLFGMLGRRLNVSSSMISDMCSELVAALVADRELLLCSMFIPHESEDYLAKHSLNTAIISVNIATAHGYNHKMVVEVGYGALLADLGMLDVDMSIRCKKEPLTALEINELKRHTIYGMDRLQLINDLPKTTALVAYQSHERLDGTGYPHRKRTHAIHDYAKITAVADVYHAMIDLRPYRAETLIPYKAMEELLAMGSKNKLDRRFIRSLLAAVSLFPVASWVKLNTGEIARVLQAKEQQFTKPTVIILYDPIGTPCDPIRVDLERTFDREVVAALKFEGDDLMVGF